LEKATNARKPFRRFRRFLRTCLRYHVPEAFEGIPTEEDTDQGDLSSSPISHRRSKKHKGDRSNAVADDSDSLSMGDTKTTRGGRFKRKRPVLENLKARNIRESDRQRLKEQEARAAQLNKRLLLQRGLASGKDQPPIVVNNSKFDDQAFVYLNEYIGRRIKSHQIEGLQFIWREIVTDFTSLQGCLLAHTMGLGKTMQV
jgi:SNF2 family DNA or RNA helicase